MKQKFSRNIVRLRKQMNLTQPQLAKKARISGSVLFAIENSPEANPSIHTLEKIARAIGVDTAYLLL